MSSPQPRAGWAVLALFGLMLAAAAPSAARAGSEVPAERLAGALRFRTLSYRETGRVDASAFRGLRRYLWEKFPRIRAHLTRRVIGGASLLYEWRGSDPHLEPMLLAAHLDVVPAPSPDSWAHPPFAGDIDGDFVWGRGALDDKSSVLGDLEAVDALLREGYSPQRTLYLAFGQDEEVGGRAGARAITRDLERRGVRLWMTLDEGAVISRGLVPGVTRPVAMIGIAEKGYLTLRLTARAPGGHSSVPEPGGAIPRVARALARLEANPLPARMSAPVASMLEALAPEMSLLPRLVMENPWLFSSLLISRLSAWPRAVAMLRTTTAETMWGGGVRENVLPRSAWAVVNLRIVPGDSVASVVNQVTHIVNDPQVRIEVLQANEPSPVSDVDSDSYRLLAHTLAETLPEAVVAPTLVLAGTDSKHYGRIAENSYRFTPVLLGPGDVARIHGVDERISIAGYDQLIRVTKAFLRRALTAQAGGKRDQSPRARNADSTRSTSSGVSTGTLLQPSTTAQRIR